MSEQASTSHKGRQGVSRLTQPRQSRGKEYRTKYGYDSLGQVVSGVKHWSDGSVVAGQQFGYAFDDIGNRTSTTAGGDQFGGNQRSASYSANSLNQYTSRTVPGAVDVIGSATNLSTVTVNNVRTYRHSDYFRAELPLANAGGAVWQSVTNLAVLSQGTNADIIATNIGNVFLPAATESYSYDADGNLTQDGRWTYIWDAENRLVNMTSLLGAPAGSKLKLDFAYDYMGRRIEKTVSTNNTGTYVQSSQNMFVYDGWSLLAILNSPSSIVSSFMWGSDLSGSMQGVSGVGGLLAITQCAPSNAQQYVCCDGNGNVCRLIDASSSAIAGQYEYGPFGEVLRASGPMAGVNPLRFSTKYEDDETALLYYGFRFYNANTGKWLNRDPLNQWGGPNLTVFTVNDPISLFDTDGRQWGGGVIIGSTPPTPPVGVFLPKPIMPGYNPFGPVIQPNSPVTFPMPTVPNPTFGPPVVIMPPEPTPTGTPVQDPTPVANPITDPGRNAPPTVTVEKSCPQWLCRKGIPWEPRDTLAADAEAAKKIPGFGYGVSVRLFTTPPGGEWKCAPKFLVEDIFRTEQTGKSKSHYTVFFTEPISWADTVSFNTLFGRTPPPKPPPFPPNAS